MIRAFLKTFSAAALSLCVLSGIAHATSASAYEGSVTPTEWDTFATAFMRPDGRVVDTANGGISHSESQGYGLMLAWMAGDREDFARIWTFTQQELRIRDDGLFAWKWAEGDRPRVKDINNASDGDILIAYALEAAGTSWGDARYRQAAQEIRAVLKLSMFENTRAGMLLLPGAEGFTPDTGVIVNPSYWVQEAFTLFADVEDDDFWTRAKNGLEPLLRAQAETGIVLSPEWMSVTRSGDVERAPDLDAGFGYNALRVPLYAVRGGGKRDVLMARVVEQVTTPAGDLLILNAEGGVKETLRDPGYKALATLVRCAILKQPEGAIPAFTSTDYYPSVLHLLSLSAARVKAPECIIQNG